MTEYPLLCINSHCRPEDHGGPRRTEHAWFCQTCIGKARGQLDEIADLWDDLERALSRSGSNASEPVGGSKDVGLVLNEKASEARATAIRNLWVWARIVFDWADNADRTIASPVDQTAPGLARWISARHLDVFTKHAGRYSAEAFMDDLRATSRAVYSSARPSGARKLPTGLPCVEHETSPEGERVPCPGTMHAWVKPSASTLPDLVCSADPTHKVDPATWQRAGWKRAHAEPMDESGMARLAQKLGGA